MAVGSELFKIDMDGKNSAPPAAEKPKKIDPPAIKKFATEPEKSSPNSSPPPPPVAHSKPIDSTMLKPASKPASKPTTIQILDDDDALPGIKIGPRTERLVNF